MTESGFPKLEPLQTRHSVAGNWFLGRIHPFLASQWQTENKEWKMCSVVNDRVFRLKMTLLAGSTTREKNLDKMKKIIEQSS